MIKKHVFVLLAVGAMTAGVQAQTIATYNFTGGSVAATGVATNIIAGSTAWTGLMNSGFSGTSSGTAFVFSASTPSAFDNSKYLSFTITADLGYALNLETLSFRLGGTNENASIPYTVEAAVRTDVGGDFASNLTINPGATTSASHTTTGATTTWSIFTADLSEAAYDNLSNQGEQR